MHYVELVSFSVSDLCGLVSSDGRDREIMDKEALEAGFPCWMDDGLSVVEAIDWHIANQ